MTPPGRPKGEYRSAQHEGRGVKRTRGFTLVEVLVALAIVAIALVAGLKASAALSSNAQRQSDVLLAHVCAENALIGLRLAKQLPAVGDSDIACEQAGLVLTVRLKVSPTPNPSFRRVDAQVFDNQTPLVRVSTVQGRY
ncbi:type II secretion system minor pseudopilin GspI [Ramlibacter sp.]|uniref:type II secretion system minor pseudopilin GspI n=1 Tax=Ramlibacter sp. TaxID=1917967 RepID=UPI0026285EC0|nr:type II secretion system minor pseudopilin GspI [Ramlibacter sp.]MDB5957244.1 type secretion system protein GspI [Ramlibacter sp.]